MKKNLIIYFIFFILCTIMGTLSMTNSDTIWSYGFSYNIASGMIPYRDFNMVIGPLYSLLLSPILKLGNYLFLFKIEHIIFYSFVLTILYRKIKWKSLLMIPLLFIQTNLFTYNVFVALLVLLMLELIDSDWKYKEVLIGILIGMIIMIKQNVGALLFLVYFFTSKEKRKSILYTMIPILPMILYLGINQSIWDYIDFCYLGLGNFAENLHIELPVIIILIFFIILLLKNYQTKKDTKVLYILAFQVMIFPLIEGGHLLVSLIPIVYYFLLEENKKIQVLLSYFIGIGTLTTLYLLITTTELVREDNVLKYSIVPNGTSYYLESYNTYLEKNNKELYLLIENAYLIRLYRGENPSFYDLINKGNLGSKEEKYIEQMRKNCKRKDCLFILSKKYFKKGKQESQYLEEFKNFIVENYDYVETLPSDDKVYEN